jgi:transposase
VIELPKETKIWIVAGATDIRRGFDGLSAQVQLALQKEPLSGHVFIFRGRRGDIVKLLWADSEGLCLFAMRLSACDSTTIPSGHTHRWLHAAGA